MRLCGACLGVVVGLLLAQTCAGQEAKRAATAAASASPAEVKGPVARPNLLTGRSQENPGAFFLGLGYKRLPELLRDPDPSLALYAAWELALWSGDDSAPPNPYRFLGYLEGRTGVKVPLRWEYGVIMEGLRDHPDRGLLESAVGKRYVSLCDFVVKDRQESGMGDYRYLPQQLVQVNLGIEGVRAPVGTSIERKDGKVVIRVGRDTVGIPETAIMKRVQTNVSICAAAIGPERSFVAVYDENGFGFPLFCVDSHSGELLWETQVWASRYLFANGPWPHHDVCLVASQKQIAVFGNSGLGCYVEAFDVESGKAAIRFLPPSNSDETRQWRQALRR